jgi:uncharacterized protein (TIGR03437 family)
MNPPGITGGAWPLSPLSRFTQSVSVTVGGEAAAAIPYAGLAPTLKSGIFQINVELPADDFRDAASLRWNWWGYQRGEGSIYSVIGFR